MSDCINGRSGCIAATQIHYHTPGYVHLEDEITAAFAALRAQLAEVTRERDRYVLAAEMFLTRVDDLGTGVLDFSLLRSAYAATKAKEAPRG